MVSSTDALRTLLSQDKLYVLPSCFDALSAKLIEQEGFSATFVSGFAAAASRIGAPDLGLMSYAEILDQVRNICDVVNFPVIGDGDTGYGNAMNVQRTVKGFAKAGCAAVLIEDQLAPKRCGHTPGKEVVSRGEAFDRIRAAVDAREAGADIMILARTDARHSHGLGEAIIRAQNFHELGADIIFVEAPQSEAEMREICKEVPGTQMANLVEGGDTPLLPTDVLHDIGYKLAIYPLTLLSSAMNAMVHSLKALKTGATEDQHLMNFTDMRARIGFDNYYDASSVYETSRR